MYVSQHACVHQKGITSKYCILTETNNLIIGLMLAVWICFKISLTVLKPACLNSMLPILLSFLASSSIHWRLTHCLTVTSLLDPLVCRATELHLRRYWHKRSHCYYYYYKWGWVIHMWMILWLLECQERILVYLVSIALDFNLVKPD